jgi:hypothetical protein
MHNVRVVSSLFVSLLCGGALVLATGCKSGGGADGDGPKVDFTQFLKDYGAGSKTFRAKYPAGKAFSMSAKAVANGSCGAAQCSIKLGGTDNSSMLFEVSPDQKNIASIKSGQSVTVSCSPEYKEGAMWTGKGCTVK